MSDRPSEATALHTQLLRFTLEASACVAYWSKTKPQQSRADFTKLAAKRRWFGDRSPARLKKLIEELSARFDRFPDAVNVLRDWKHMSRGTSKLVCHWHLQLSDPVYRWFTGDLLPGLRSAGVRCATREIAAGWLDRVVSERWADSTKLKFASNLITATSEAGLVAPPTQGRAILLPDVPDDALAYILHLLLNTEFAGSLTDNPYLRSVGMDGPRLVDAVGRLSGGRHVENGDDDDDDMEDDDDLMDMGDDDDGMDSGENCGGFGLAWMARDITEWASRRG
ncbi:MAG: DUF1819 domain-containing protein [Polyangiaceae bacterium]|nr:DUF1819 domain-containing protein [Polyangiaceae bacterium]